MNYRFDEIIDRRETDSMKWNVAEGELPMWVADMDFATAPEIMAAIQKRAQNGAFGYTELSDGWYEAYQSWWERRHHFRLEKDWLVFCTGIVPAISSIVRKLTTPNEKVLIQTPVYNIFFNSIINNGCRVEESPLVLEHGEYEIDWEELEKKLRDPQTTLMILCNPHNPVGKIWDVDTLRKIGSLCYKHHVVVIADEIHCDLTLPGREYVPFASVSEECRENSITCIAPTKTFNLAGLQTAAVSVPNSVLRHKVWRGLNTDEVAEPNCFAALAAEVAFQEGEAWLEELRQYLAENRRRAELFISAELPTARVIMGEATYLLWIDVRKHNFDGEEPAEYIRRKTGLFLCDGSEYGVSGQGFLRLNLACPRELLEDGLQRLKKALEA